MLLPVSTQKLHKTSLFLTMYFNIQANNRKINEKSEKSTKKQEIGRLQTAPHGRRIVGILKIEYQWKVQD